MSDNTPACGLVGHGSATFTQHCDGRRFQTPVLYRKRWSIRTLLTSEFVVGIHEVPDLEVCNLIRTSLLGLSNGARQCSGARFGTREKLRPREREREREIQPLPCPRDLSPTRATSHHERSGSLSRSESGETTELRFSTHESWTIAHDSERKSRSIQTRAVHCQQGSCS
jgi:hypothetical protein